MPRFWLLTLLLASAPVLCAAGSVPPSLHRSPKEEAERAREAFALAGVALDEGRYSDAQGLYREVTTLAPEWALAFVQLGAALLAEFVDNNDAVNALNRAIKLDDDIPRAHMLLGHALAQRNQYELARDAYKKALSLRGDLHDARLGLAGALAVVGPAAQAIVTYREVLKSDPQNFAVLSALADLYEQTSQNSSAESALLAITRLFPTVPYHRYRLAQFYERIGENKKASRVFAELEEKDPRQRKMRKLR